MILGHIDYFPIYFYIDYEGISVFGEDKAGPVKSLGAKFHCIEKRRAVTGSNGQYSVHV